MRGPYPGLGSALAAAGLERGALIAHRVVDALEDPAADPWPAVDQAIAEAREGRGVATGLVGRVASRLWDRLVQDANRFRFLKLIARFPFTVDQARRFFDPDARATARIMAGQDEFLRNPYLFYETDRGRLNAVTLQAIDRSLFPRDASARDALSREPLPEPITEAGDDRRVRAACTYLLERAATEGHTLLDEASLRRRLSTLELDPGCDPTTDVFELATDGFEPVLSPTALANERGRGWRLKRLAEVSELIAAEVATRTQSGPLRAEWDWRGTDRRRHRTGLRS